MRAKFHDNHLCLHLQYQQGFHFREILTAFAHFRLSIDVGLSRDLCFY